MLELFLPVIIEIVELIIKVLVIPVVVMAVKWASDKVKNDLIRRIIEDAVRYAQQLYYEEDGDTRYIEALEIASGRLERLGINLSLEELDVLIEATLKKIKDAVGENW